MLIDIYGLTIKCESSSPHLAALLAKPFRYYFREHGVHSVAVKINRDDPPYDSLSPIAASFHTPRNSIYHDDSGKIVDYFGTGVVIENRQKSLYTLYSRDQDLLQDIFYQLIISLFSRHCDRHGLLRFPAVGVTHRDRAVLLTGMSATDASPLLSSMLKFDQVNLISGLHPIVNSSGNILPFPVPVGFRDQQAIEAVPREFVYETDRMQYGFNYFVDCDFWKDRIETRSLEDSIIFVSRTVLNGKPSIERIAKAQFLASVIRNVLLENRDAERSELLGYTTWDRFYLVYVVLKRLFLLFKVTAASETYQITLVRDVNENAALLQDFICNL